MIKHVKIANNMKIYKVEGEKKCGRIVLNSIDFERRQGSKRDFRSQQKCLEASRLCRYPSRGNAFAGSIMGFPILREENWGHLENEFRFTFCMHDTAYV